MTPVGILLVILGLAAAYQAATRGPAFVAGLIATAVAIILHSLAARAAEAVKRHQKTRDGDRWARTSRAERTLLSKDLKRTMSLTMIMGLFPRQAMTGYKIARQFKLA